MIRMLDRTWACLRAALLSIGPLLVTPSVLSAQDVEPVPSVQGWDTTSVYDPVRERRIPIAIMRPTHPAEVPCSVVLISHGYNANAPGTYLLFRGIAKGLADVGFAVVSVQLELPGDTPLPLRGDPRTVRRPIWDRGVQDLLAVIQALVVQEPTWALDKVDLIGHSNGGDISMLLAQEHPEVVHTAVSMDNLRMPLPRTAVPRIVSLRAEDTTADPGVLPTAEEQRIHRIEVITMLGFKHVHFNDRASPAQRQELVRVLVEVLREGTVR